MGASGKNGTINGSGDTIKAWTVDIATELLDDTTMGSGGYRQWVEGLVSGTGTITATAKYAGAATINLVNAQNGYSGSAYFSSKAVETSVDGLLAYTHSFSFHGSITEV